MISDSCIAQERQAKPKWMLQAYVFTLSKLPVTAAATLLTLASLNNNTTKETVLVDVALPKETKIINVKVNIVGILLS
jgi:hypothetical protein